MKMRNHDLTSTTVAVFETRPLAQKSTEAGYQYLVNQLSNDIGRKAGTNPRPSRQVAGAESGNRGCGR